MKAQVLQHTQCLNALDKRFQELALIAERTNQTLSNFVDRLDVLEASATPEVVALDGPQSLLPIPEQQPEDLSARLWQLEKELEHTSSRLGRIENESRGDLGWGSRLEEHEVRLRGLRAKIDTQEGSIQSLSERSRQEWVTRFQQLRQHVSEKHREHLVIEGRMAALERWAAEAKDIFDLSHSLQGSALFSDAADAAHPQAHGGGRSVQEIHEAAPEVGKESGVLRP